MLIFPKTNEARRNCILIALIYLALIPIGYGALSDGLANVFAQVFVLMALFTAWLAAKDWVIGFIYTLAAERISRTGVRLWWQYVWRDEWTAWQIREHYFAKMRAEDAQRELKNVQQKRRETEGRLATLRRAQRIAQKAKDAGASDAFQKRLANLVLQGEDDQAREMLEYLRTLSDSFRRAEALGEGMADVLLAIVREQGVQAAKTFLQEASRYR